MLVAHRAIEAALRDIVATRIEMNVTKPLVGVILRQSARHSLKRCASKRCSDQTVSQD
jgi:hypothetical protein